jgi:hypothetical protein
VLRLVSVAALAWPSGVGGSMNVKGAGLLVGLGVCLQLVACGEWTCAAYCLTEYSCTTNGTSTTNAKLVVSSGSDAARAFTRLVGQCASAHAYLVVGATCQDGKLVTAPAAIANACGH